MRKLSWPVLQPPRQHGALSPRQHWLTHRKTAPLVIKDFS
jgi:hypothetical protein